MVIVGLQRLFFFDNPFIVTELDADNATYFLN